MFDFTNKNIPNKRASLTKNKRTMNPIEEVMIHGKSGLLKNSWCVCGARHRISEA